MEKYSLDLKPLIKALESVKSKKIGQKLENILELTDSNYAKFMQETQGIVFIDFYSDTCPPCQTLLAYLPNIAENYKDKEVIIAKVNSAHNPKLSKKFMVRSVPLTVLIGKDKMVKRAEVGLLTLNAYFKMIDKEINQGKGFFSNFFN